VIVSFILIIWMFEQAVIMQGEISFSSLLGLKGLTHLLCCYEHSFFVDEECQTINFI